MGSVVFSNASGVDIDIVYLKINETVMFQYVDGKNKPIKIRDVQTYCTVYDEKDWNDFSRMWLTVSVDGKQYSVDLNRDHYFFGGDCHYPGIGSMVNYFFSGFSEDGTSIQFNEGYAKGYNNDLTYSSDFKYLTS
ncbi:hypothetical protein [Azospirillum sp. B506]|uniref:hypothetical protein n=1 Tax=Azospirillum sp. B506 TaxID=137721 RepID=UPI0011DCB0A3|nr:hypothetical protein [Azospirillum sp. B506]